jgi:alkylation response protein AidB-like acyl-CoA dehydrogenase
MAANVQQLHSAATPTDTTPTDTTGPTPDQELAAFLGEALPRFRSEWGDDDSFEAHLAWQKVLAEGHWVAPAWPVEHGGRGLGSADQIACEEVVAASGAPMIAGTLGVKNVGPTIAIWGTPEQKTHLSRILDGTEIWCQGFSEPDIGSDLAGLRTRAVLDGDQFVINGEKIWTSSGLRATHMQLLARTDPSAAKHKGISALLIPLDVAGIDRRPIRQMDGKAEFAAMAFDNVRVPSSALLGPINEGWRVTMTTLAYERSGVAVFATRLEDETMRFVERLRAAPPLDPVLRDEIVRRYIDGRVLGLLGRKVLAALVAGKQPGPEQSIIKLAWSLARQRLAEAEFAVAGIAATGGLAPEVTQAFLTSRSATIAAGTTEVMKNILGERVLGLPR